MINHWTFRFLKLADEVASWSKDPSTKVGAVIYNPKTKIINGVGYNGLPRGVEDKLIRLYERETKMQMVIHAEENAILNSNRSVDGCYICITQPPCAPCTARLIQSGIRAVFYYTPSEGLAERFSESLRISKEMMYEVDCFYAELPRPRE